MALSLNGMLVLGKISDNAKLFADVKPDVDKQARVLVVKQLKAKADDLETLRLVKRALGPNAFTSIVDGLSDADVKSMLNKLDKYHPELKRSNAAWRRDHLRELAGGKVKPTPPPEPKTPPKPAKPKRRRTLDLESMQAKPKRR